MASVLQVEELRGSTTGANANKIIIPSGQTLDASAGGLVPAAGQVVQVVMNYDPNTSHITTTSSNLVAAGFSVSITPTSTDSFIIIQMFNPMVHHQTAVIEGRMYVNGSAMPNSSLYHLGYQDYQSTYGGWHFAGKYQPTSLAQLTFEPYFKSSSNGTSVRFSHEDSSLSLIATEIAG